MKTCYFRIRGGGTLVIAIDKISHIIIDSETLKSKLYIVGSQFPIIISNKPEEIMAEMQQNNEKPNVIQG